MCRVFMALITAMVLRVTSQDSLMPVRKVHTVSLTTGFKVGREPCYKKSETDARKHPASLAHIAGTYPKPLVNWSEDLTAELPKRHRV